MNTTLPFELRSAPKIFTAVANAVEWIAWKEGTRFVIHYLDDFLVIRAPNSPECTDALVRLLRLFEWLGLPVAVEKREGPATCLEFLGFEVDSVAIDGDPPALAEARRPGEVLHEWPGRKATVRNRWSGNWHTLPEL